MDYKIDDKKVIFRLLLHGKSFEFSLAYDAIYNTVMREQKFNSKPTSATAELVPATGLSDFINYLENYISGLSQFPKINEYYLGYALKSTCYIHLSKYGRLIDVDLASYADTLMIIYDSWLENKLDYKEGFTLRSNLIKLMLSWFEDVVFITKLVTPSNPLELENSFELEKYNKETNNIGFLLRI